MFGCALLAMLPACAAAPTTTASEPKAESVCRVHTTSFQKLLAQYQSLAPLRGHFDGERWNPDIDQYGAAKYCVMDALRQALVLKRASLVQTLAWLGAPDARWATDEPAQRVMADAMPRGLGAVDEYLWYRWRGQRDGLLLAVHQGRVIFAGWALSGE